MRRLEKEFALLIFSLCLIALAGILFSPTDANARETQWRSKTYDDEAGTSRSDESRTTPSDRGREERTEPAPRNQDTLNVRNENQVDAERERMEEAARARQALRDRRNRSAPVPAQDVQPNPPGNEGGAAVNVIPPQIQPPTMPGLPGMPGQQRGNVGATEEKPENPILYMEPVTTTVDVGQVFTLSIKLDNPKDVSFDQLGVTLSYDPRMLAVVPFEGLSGGEVVRSATAGLVQPGSKFDLLMNKGDAKRGMVYYHVHLPAGETRRFKGVLGDIQFQALAPVQSTLVKFVMSNAKEDIPELTAGQPLTYLSLAGEDVLGQAGVLDDGTLSTNVRVAPEGSDAARIITTEKDVMTTADIKEPLSLSIVPSSLSVKEGDDFVVRLKLNNKGKTPFDYLCVLLQFDPEHIRILDWDEGNWIKNGINIHDGSFHMDFPFDLSRSNRVFRSSQGTFIDYRQGGYRTELNSDGAFAEIHAQALRPASLTRMVFRFQKNGMEPTTGVFLNGVNLLGGPEQEMAVEGLQLQVLPSRAARANGK